MIIWLSLASLNLFILFRMTFALEEEVGMEVATPLRNAMPKVVPVQGHALLDSESVASVCNVNDMREVYNLI